MAKATSTIRVRFFAQDGRQIFETTADKLLAEELTEGQHVELYGSGYDITDVSTVLDVVTGTWSVNVRLT